MWVFDFDGVEVVVFVEYDGWLVIWLVCDVFLLGWWVYWLVFVDEVLGWELVFGIDIVNEYYWLVVDFECGGVLLLLV